MSAWGNNKPEQKRQAGGGTGWLVSPRGYKVVRIASADATAHAQWVEITEANVTDAGRMQIWHNRRMLL